MVTYINLLLFGLVAHLDLLHAKLALSSISYSTEKTYAMVVV